MLLPETAIFDTSLLNGQQKLHSSNVRYMVVN